MGSKDRLYADIMAVHPEVTGSCNLVIVKQPDNSTVKFVVDCGLFQERQYSKNNESLPFYLLTSISVWLRIIMWIMLVACLLWLTRGSTKKSIWLRQLQSSCLWLWRIATRCYEMLQNGRIIRRCTARPMCLRPWDWFILASIMRLFRFARISRQHSLWMATWWELLAFLFKSVGRDTKQLICFSLETITTRTCSSMYQTFRIGYSTFRLRWFRNPLMETWTPMRLLAALSRMCWSASSMEVRLLHQSFR